MHTLFPKQAPFQSLLIYFILALSTSLSYGQNSFNSGDGWGAGWGTGQSMSPSIGSSFISIYTNSSGFGDRYFRLYGNGTPCGQYGPQFSSQFLNFDTEYNLTCGNNTYAYFVSVANSTNNYVFKTESVSAAKLIVFEVQGAVRSVTSVSTPAIVQPNKAIPIVATLDGNISSGQGVYLRYTNDNFATSTFVEMTGSGTEFTANIPDSINTPGATVSYLVITSGDGLTLTTSNQDFYAININNNSGSNYTYTVALDGEPGSGSMLTFDGTNDNVSIPSLANYNFSN